jgi:two-component system chemotaxis response regulator CheY
VTKSILIVDDSSTMRMHISGLLARQGFDVHEASSGEAGLLHAKTRKLDLIIVDVNMPEMDGIEMVAELRKLPAHADTPVFMLTAESDVSTVQRGRTAGATAWIVKPFRPEVLLTGIKRVLGG